MILQSFQFRYDVFRKHFTARRQELPEFDERRAQLFQRFAHAFTARHIIQPLTRSGDPAYNVHHGMRKRNSLDILVEAVTKQDGHDFLNPSKIVK
jgi:hypothetical protein